MTREEERLGAALEFYDKHKSAASNVTLVDSFVYGTKWADAHPNTEDIETILAYTYKGLSWLAENVEADMGTTAERALACTETLQLICNRVIMELRDEKTDNHNH